MNKHSRSSISKPHITSGIRSSKRVSFKAGKGSESLKNMDEDDFDGDLDSNAFFDSQSFDSKSCGESVNEFQVELENELVSELLSESVMIINEFTVTKKGSVNDDYVANDIGQMPVPVSENPVLNPNRNMVDSPRISPNGSPRILKRGEVLSDVANANFSFSQVEKWPKLARTDKGSSPKGNDMKVDENVVSSDKVMKENVVENKYFSFRNAVVTA
ncbi:hypothetical protein Tco_0023277 [Tanacetum coccineum]